MRRLVPFVLAVLAACSSTGPTADPTADPTVAPSTPVASPTPTPTSPAPAAPFVFAVVGDWGAGTDAQARVARRMCATRVDAGFTDVVTTGDNFYDPDGVARRHNYYAPQECLIEAPDVRWRATWGNHDAAGLSTRRVLGARHWYAWSGGGADLIALDSNMTDSAEQRAFLRDRLAGSNAAVKIVYFHHPPFTVGAGHPNDERVQRAWVPLFERFDVTLVLTGHQHDYEHSRVNGIDYVVTGGGGQVLYACVRTPPTLIRCESTYHFLLVTIDGRRVRVRAIEPDGSTLDRFSIVA